MLDGNGNDRVILSIEDGAGEDSLQRRQDRSWSASRGWLESREWRGEKLAQGQGRRANGRCLRQGGGLDLQAVAEGREDAFLDECADRFEEEIAGAGEVAPEEDQLRIESVGDRDKAGGEVARDIVEDAPREAIPRACGGDRRVKGQRRNPPIRAAQDRWRFRWVVQW